MLLKRVLNSALFWGAWIIIPFLMEILPALGCVFLLLRRRFQNRKPHEKPTLSPDVSIIVPVYNSQETLRACIASINASTYPNECIHILLVNNQSRDNSFQVYAQCQTEFPSLQMQWLNAEQGKSRALNMALYNSNGKYIINLDSDGVLEPHALENLVNKFEENPDLSCMTGAVLTDPRLIGHYHLLFPRLLRELEFMEYAQAFLAGRSYASSINAVYTLSGAFSAFRKSAVLSSRLYNTDTISEDTQITFQMKYLQKERVEICEDAIFFVDPIEDVNKLYTQRQRWQRGSLEVAQQFAKDSSAKRPLFDVNTKTLLYDHTFAFPRMIWYLATLCLMQMQVLNLAALYATVLIFLLYTLTGFIYFFSNLALLKAMPEIRRYYRSHWWVVPLLPLFNLAVFFIRIAGIINSIGTDSTWAARNLTQEHDLFEATVKQEWQKPQNAVRRVKEHLNSEKAPAPIPNAVLPVSWYFFSGIVLFLSAALLITVRWTTSVYGIGLNELLNTLGGNLKGTANDVVIAVIKGCVVPVFAAMAVYALFAFFDRRFCARRAQTKKSRKPGTVLSRSLPRLGALLLAVALLYANVKFDVIGYYKKQLSSSNIYEDYYIFPQDTAITATGKTKNLIYIYLESMETTYASTQDGGRQSVNYMPQLTQLARENTSFSNSDLLGGFHTVTGAGYTMAAIYTTTSGVPFALPLDSTSLSETADNFASGLVNLGDILHEKGYHQEFLCGSDAAFGGRKLWFTQHGQYDIFDLYTAREKGYIPADYYVWWGFEDHHLFDIAKDEATRLYENGEPFNLTMLTVDAHHIAGYHCDECGNEYSPDTANVIACTDRQVTQFVEWCKQQPFYDDTVIVITGDHPRMDTYLVDGVSYYDRTVYNCFINSAVSTDNLQNREFTHMDIFPTTLAAMGYSIEGDRLALGTNLFSSQPTLAEQKSFDWVETEVSKSSEYYIKTFAPELLE